MTSTAPLSTAATSRGKNVATQREIQIKKRYTARLRRGDLLETLVYFSVAIVLALFLADGGASYFLNIKDVTTGIGIVTADVLATAIISGGSETLNQITQDFSVAVVTVGLDGAVQANARFQELVAR